MARKEFLSKINDVLNGHRFHQYDLKWNRQCNDFIDVIDLQTSQSGDTFTINIGVAEKSISQLCWGLGSTDIIDESSCTVRARLGVLIYSRDVWWSLSHSGSIDDVLYEICNTAIPFLRLNHSIEKMIESLHKNPSVNNYSPEAIYLALLYNLRGDGARSREMLRSLQARASDGWRQKISEILDALN